VTSGDIYSEKIRRFIEKYPLENYLAFKIVNEFNDIYNNMNPNSDSGGFNKEVKFNVVKTMNGSNTISMTEEGLFFLGAMAGAITKNILVFLGSPSYEQRLNQQAKEAAKEYVTQVNPFLIQSPKRCSKCNLDNDYNANFCKQCAISYKNKLVKAN
jgi:hypothetical protein